MIARSNQNGFTLIETVVALAILGACLAALSSSFAQSLTAMDRAARYQTLNAQTLNQLEQLGVTIPLKPGLTQGVTSDGTRWRVNVREEERLVSKTGPQIVRIQLTLRGSSGQTASIETLRLRSTQ